MTDDLHWTTATELSRMYRTAEVSPVEVVEACIARLEATEPHLNAFVTRTVESAREAAVAAERRLRSGEDLPALFGVPITVKDLTETAGVRTTYGSTVFADFVPEESAISWERLSSQGVIMLGKTTTPEFGLLGVGESRLTGTTKNPWNTDLGTGGSSAGAAASVVAGVGPLAWGSDGGGSIRVPASLCGAVGVKPSIGRIPTADSTDGDSTEGPLARTVADAALLLDATVGPHPSDRFSLPATGENYSAIVRDAPADFRGLRISAITDLGQGVLHPDVEAGFEAALLHLESAGAIVERREIRLPDTTEYFDHLNGPEYATYVDEMIAGGLPEAEIWPMILELAERGRRTTGIQTSLAFRNLKTDIYNAFLGALDGVDLLLSATTPVPAFRHGSDYGPVIPIRDEVVPPWGKFVHSMTEPPSHAGVPAVSVVGGFTPSGLPIGLQFMARPWDDAGAVQAAARWQNTTEWHTRHPSL